MARKVFISFLGAGRYSDCWYTVDGKRLTQQPVRFVQEAMVRHLCMDEASPWSRDDRILIFCTHYSDINKKDGAKEINWCDNNRFSPFGLEHYLKGLTSQGLQPLVEMVEIPSGFNEREIWGIFSVVYDKLKEVLTDGVTGQRVKGELYFDVTHAFRSIPLFSLVLFNHARVLLGARLKAIKYGAFEAAPDIIDPSTGKPSSAPKEAPVLDLTSIARLQTFNQLANDFKEFGKIKNLGHELSFLKGLPGDAIGQLREAINLLHEHITTSSQKRLKAGKFIELFNDSIDQVIERDDVLLPFKNILLELKASLTDFHGGNANIEAAIKWSHRYDLVTQAYTLADEYIISRVLETVTTMIPQGLEKKRHRDFVSAILAMSDAQFMSPRGDIKTHYHEAMRIRQLPLVQQLLPNTMKINWCRNELAHATGQVPYNTFVNNYACIERCLEILKSQASPVENEPTVMPPAAPPRPTVQHKVDTAAADGPTPEPRENIPATSAQAAPAGTRAERLLINLSRPKSTEWADRHKKAASNYADTIIDLTYRRPDWDSPDNEVKDLAKKCADKVLAQGDPRQTTVNITGFDTAFIFQVVAMLKDKGVRCVASIYNRDKVFIQFREY